MSNILSLTLNPAIDFNITIQGVLTKGKVNRSDKYFKMAGGKGINVASYLSDLGLKNVGATGFLGLENAHYFKEHFINKGILDMFIYFNGSTRENVKIVETDNAATTDINLNSKYLEVPCLQLLRNLINTASYKSDYFVFSGSIPNWLDDSIYYELGKDLKVKDKKIIVDTSGLPLKFALDLPPFAIKPNIDEFYELYNGILSYDDILGNIINLLDSGIEYVLLSMGAEGALLANKRSIIKVKGQLSRLVTSVGAGDAFLAGFIFGLIKDFDLKNLAIFSTATSLALLESEDRNLPDSDTILNNYHNKITVEEVIAF
jgi:1-phosphofructokinase family hexose kinase